MVENATVADRATRGSCCGMYGTLAWLGDFAQDPPRAAKVNALVRRAPKIKGLGVMFELKD